MLKDNDMLTNNNIAEKTIVVNKQNNDCPLATRLTLQYCQMAELTDFLFEQMESKGWSQNELARRANVDPGHLNRIIRGERAAGPETLRALADVLDYPPASLFVLAGLLPQDSEISEREREALYLLRQLSPEERRYLVDQMRFMLGRQKQRDPSNLPDAMEIAKR